MATKALQYGQIVKLIQNGALYAFSSAKVGDQYTLISNGENTVPYDNLPAGALLVLNVGTANTTTAPTIKLADPQVALPITKKGGGALAIGELSTGSQILISRVTHFELMPLGGLVSSVAGRVGDVVLTKTDVGLGNVDNTSDLLKPISTVTQSALNNKQDTLISATNIKTINGASILGAGDLVVNSSILTDLVPTDGSTNPVQSNGVFDSLALKSDSTHNHTLDSLSNVVITANSDNEILAWDSTSSKWINQTAAEALLATSTHTHANLIAGNGITGTTYTGATSYTWSVVSHAGTAGSIGTLSIGTDTIGVSLGTTSTTAAAGNHMHDGIYQPASADLTSIDALAGTTGLLRKTASDTWALDTTAYGTGTVTSVTASGAIASSGGTAPAITHLTTDGNLHVPATGTTNNGKVLTAGVTAGSLSWTTPTVGTVTNVTGTAPIVSSGGATPAISIPEATSIANGYMTSTYASKLDGIATGAEVNQFAFSNVAVSGQTTVAADLKTDTLTLVAGTNIVLTTDVNTDSITIGSSSAAVYGKNLLINSNGLVNQRGYVSGTATTVANQYTVDRWRVVTSGQNLTFATALGLTTFTAPVGGVEQVIEDLSILGGSYVLSFTGTATALVSESSDNVTYTTVTPSAGVYTITGGYYVRVRFSSGTFSKAKFELGTAATPYESNSYMGELMSCLRYYEFINTSRRAGRAQTTTIILFEPVHLLAQKRVTPTLVVTKYDTPSGYTSVGTLIAAYNGNGFQQVQDITAVGLTAGTIASALISFTLSAEL